MTSNIRTVQELYAAFGKGDVPGIRTVLSPDVEWREAENPFKRFQEFFDTYAGGEAFRS